MNFESEMRKLARLLATRVNGDWDPDAGYLEQEASADFARLLAYNCLLFCQLYRCHRNRGCGNCLAMKTLDMAEARYPELKECLATRRILVEGIP